MFYDRRGARGSRRMPARNKSLFQQSLALALVWFDASGHITLSGTGDVLSIHDRKDDTHVLTQADTVKQVDPPAAHADFAGQMCFTFVAANQNWYASNRGVASWPFVHSGAAPGVEWATCFTPTADQVQTFLSTHTTGAQTGMLFRSTNTAGNIDIGGLNATGGAFAYQRTVAAAIPAGTPTWLTVNYLEGDATESELFRRGISISSGSSATAPTTNNPPATLNVGRRANDTAFASMRLRSLSFFPKLTPAPRAAVDLYHATQVAA